jgi:hypothetical protein
MQANPFCCKQGTLKKAAPFDVLKALIDWNWKFDTPPFPAVAADQLCGHAAH